MPRHHHGRHTRRPRHLAVAVRAGTPPPRRAMLLLTCVLALVGLLVALPNATATSVTSRFGASADAYVS